MPSPKKRVEPPVHFKGVIVFFLLVLCFCVYAFYYVRPLPEPDKPVVTIVTKPPKVRDYSPSCRQATQILHRYWRNLGVPEKDFKILAQSPYHEAGKKWIFTEAKVFLPKEVDTLQAANDLAGELKGFSPPFFFQVDRREENRVFASIKVDDVVTHSLLLVPAPPRLAVIIDDIGGNLETTRRFLDLGIPLTLSILPGLAHSKESEDLAHEYGYEVMLHLPMEPKGLAEHNPGRGAIATDMSEAAIYEIMTSHLGNFTYIKGVNNHMGSRATENERVMHSVLNVLKPRGLYFIDSRTSSQSVAFRMAQEMEMPSGKNELFLDNEPEVDYCKDFIDRAIHRVKTEGSGIVIGHPRETTLHALREMSSRIEEEGISLVFVSDLVL
jgi:polysaccharide deacetylase 2 family uncharacterized protein YibQ